MMRYIFHSLRGCSQRLYRFVIAGLVLVLAPYECVKRTLKQYRDFNRACVQIAAVDWSGRDGGVVEEEISVAVASTMWLVGEMENLRALFTTATQTEPLGWIMGVDEYTSLRTEVFSRMDTVQRERFGEIVQWQGLPVHIKSSRGVELALDLKTALHFKDVITKIRPRNEAMI